jgi:nicotinamidase-related amidase
MPLTELDDRAALIVIDLQKGILQYPTVHPVPEIVAHSAELARAFRARGLPVVLVNVTAGAPGRTQVGVPKVSRPPDWAELVPELAQSPSDILITKQRWGAFTGTVLDAELRRHNVTQVFITGVSTSAGVESTARTAHEHGYHVVLVTDAMTDRDLDTHRHSIEKIFPRLGETATTAEVLQRLTKTEARTGRGAS